MRYMFDLQSKKTLSVSLPIIIGELIQFSLHLIDTLMVGQIGYKELAAASLVNSVINIPFVLGVGITSSVAQMVSAANGQADHAKVSHYFFNGFTLCLLAALLIAGGLDLGRNILFHLNQDAMVAILAARYMHVLCWSLLPMLLFLTLKQFADGLQKTKAAMYLSVLALPMNIFINWLLIYGHWGFGAMGLVGAAYGTLITRWVIFLVFALVLLFHSEFRHYFSSHRNQLQWSATALRRLLSIGIPASIQAGVEVFAFALSGILMGMLGPVQLAAHQIVMGCATFAFMAAFGFAQGSSIRISTAWGKSDADEIWQIGKGALAMALVYGLLCALFFILGSSLIPALFNNDAHVISLAAMLFVFAAIFQVTSAVQIVSTSILRGVRDIKAPTKIISIAYWVVGLPLGYLLAFRMGAGAAGIWIGLLTGLGLSAITLSTRFLRKNKIVNTIQPIKI
jgi:MATE family multidrug resistance protein